MRRAWRHSTVRSKILMTVFAGAILPLTIVGFWIARTAERSGLELLRSRSNEILDVVASQVEENWRHRESDLRLIVENEDVNRLLRTTPAAVLRDSAARVFLRASLERPDHPEYVLYRDGSGVSQWSAFSDAAGIVRIQRAAPMSGIAPASAGLVIILAAFDTRTGNRIGSLEARLRFASLLQRTPDLPGGAVLGAKDRRSGEPILHTDLDSSTMSAQQFTYGAEEWLSTSRALARPPIDLTLSARVAPYTAPFLRNARRGLLALVLVSLCVILAVTVATRRITRSLEAVATAARAVARGDLQRQLDVADDDEVGQLAQDFNTMTQSLRTTLRELAQREALAAIGEFASSLAHEVRNPLTSVRLDLQLLDERLTGHPNARPLVARALKDIDRLVRTVNGVLRMARSGQILREEMDIRLAIEAAIDLAAVEFAQHGALLEPPMFGERPLFVNGDTAALTQLFLNALINAAQALPSGGRAGVRVASSEGEVQVIVWDNGPGIPLQHQARIFEPFYTTKKQGTGLGLPISQRIAAAHGGRIELVTATEGGAVFSCWLPSSVSW